jgi:SOS-response transcriptional repressor LexA
VKADLAPYSGPGKGRPPTERQAEVLRFIARSISEHGFPPTLREVCLGLGLVSTNGASDHITGLIRKGMVTRAPLISRGIALTAAGRAYLAECPAPAPESFLTQCRELAPESGPPAPVEPAAVEGER